MAVAGSAAPARRPLPRTASTTHAVQRTPTPPDWTHAAHDALARATDSYRHLVGTPHAHNWQVVQPGSLPSAQTASTITQPGPLVQGLAPLDPAQVRIHRRRRPRPLGPKPDPLPDVYRAVAHVPCDPNTVSLDAVRALLGTPELRPQWDRLADLQTALVRFDARTSVVKTDYRVGWPASPRDTVTVQKTWVNPESESEGKAGEGSRGSGRGLGRRALVDISTSLSRAKLKDGDQERPDGAADEPAFLRPAPPFVRAHTHLAAWSFELVSAQETLEDQDSGADGPDRTANQRVSSQPDPQQRALPPTSDWQGQEESYLRITLFWQWDLKLPSVVTTSSPAHATGAAPSPPALPVHPAAAAEAAAPSSDAPTASGSPSSGPNRSSAFASASASTSPTRASTTTPSTASTATATATHLSTLIASLISHLRLASPGAEPLPLVSAYGDGVELNRDEWEGAAPSTGAGATAGGGGAAGKRRLVEYAVVWRAKEEEEERKEVGTGDDEGERSGTAAPRRRRSGDAQEEAADSSSAQDERSANSSSDGLQGKERQAQTSGAAPPASAFGADPARSPTPPPPPAATEPAPSASKNEVARDDLRKLDEKCRRRERTRLARTLEISLPALAVGAAARTPSGIGKEGEGKGKEDEAAASPGDGWDVKITVKALGGGSGATPAATPGLVATTAAAVSPGLATPSASSPFGVPTTATEPPNYSVELIGRGAGPTPASSSRERAPAGAPSKQDSSSTRTQPLPPPPPPPTLTLRISHPPLRSPSHLLRVTVTVQRSTGGKCVRVNGEEVPVKWTSRERRASEGGAGGTQSLREVLRAWKRSGGEEVVSEGQAGEGEPGSVPGEAPEGGDGTSGDTAVMARSASPPTAAPGSAPATQIASLLRRSYIYFLSLLQEPPAKWRHVSDSAGVSVTQLLSPDPTLTIYRAEAVFVGVGVWDAFATVVTPGVRRTWDRNVEGAVLVADEGTPGATAGELSEVWWERRKGVWPVSARDSVLLRTAYKSPSSIHIFSSSTDNTTLFPSIPPPAEGTIRTQTDLFGWSIEALSPTTTQITLLDQSDPKGWSTKSSWTPQALIQAVAGVRDYSLKNGAPPVVTRLGGRVRKTSEDYDPDKAALRVSYAPLASLHADDGAEETVECEVRCDATTWAAGPAGGVDVVIEPPPGRVSCLLRHRLSAGGGLWLTIEHRRAVVVEAGRVVMTVRKGSSPGDKSSSAAAAAAANGSSPAVLVNGARVKVDVEVLDDDKVRELEHRKRVKAAPVPLDQYETLGPRSGAAALARATGLGSSAVGGLPNGAEPASTQEAAVLGQEKGLSALGKAMPPAASASTTDPIAPADGVLPSESGSAPAEPAPEAVPSAALADPTAPGAPGPPTKAPREPPACALEALAWLQTFHAEQGPELTDPAPGWSNVSERGGVVVRKKVLPRISATIPVYRGDKIVQGLTAEEIASIVTSAGCRKAWDDRVESATPLASYGHGVSTVALVTKPTFPFRGRLFHVATVNAAVKVPSASSSSSTSTVLFVASASYSSPLRDQFSTEKLNPLSLPSGQVLLEGWILETLDPYTSSVLAIPSTRCTFVSCTDQKGSVPLALNTTLNANLAKALSSVEQFGKTRGPLPRVWAPSLGLQIEGPLTDDSSDEDFVWRLTGADDEGATQGVLADYAVSESAFRTVARVPSKLEEAEPKAGDVDESESARPGMRKAVSSSEKGTPGKAKAPPTLAPPVPPGSALLKNEGPRAGSLNLVSTAPPVLHKAPIMSELSRKSSHNSLRAAASPPQSAASGTASTTKIAPLAPSPTSIASSTITDPAAHDLLVAELVVDLKQYPHGYSVWAKSQLVPAGQEGPLSLDAVAAPSSGTTHKFPSGELPLRCVAHDAPLPSILTASLDAWKRANHLVRVLVPTGAMTHASPDATRENDSTAVPKQPDWYTAFQASDGALVEIVITALPAPPPLAHDRTHKSTDRNREQADAPVSKVTGQANKTVIFNGEKLVLLTQKESKSVLARFEDDDLPLQGAKISRVPPRKRRKSSAAHDADADRSMPPHLPTRFQEPLAIASRLLAPKPVAPEPEDLAFPDPKAPDVSTPANEEARSPAGTAATALTPTASRRSTVTATGPTTPGGPLLGLLSGYPLSRLSLASTVDVTETSPSGAVAVRRTYTLSLVLLVAIISFLLGSFLRSLLTPADYIIYRPESAARHSDVEHALLSALDVNRRWREARRLLELRGLFGWDLLVAAVKRD